jgi:hypothetical protein
MAHNFHYKPSVHHEMLLGKYHKVVTRVSQIQLLFRSTVGLATDPKCTFSNEILPPLSSSGFACGKSFIFGFSCKHVVMLLSKEQSDSLEIHLCSTLFKSQESLSS